jgi:hypothetical protein
MVTQRVGNQQWVFLLVPAGCHGGLTSGIFHTTVCPQGSCGSMLVSKPFCVCVLFEKRMCTLEKANVHPQITDTYQIANPRVPKAIGRVPGSRHISILIEYNIL